MPSKKHRPIVMNRNKTPGRTYKILKRALLITALLAFIEVIILVVIHYRNADKAVAKKQEQPKEKRQTAARNTPKTDAVVKPKDTVAIMKPAAEKTQPAERGPVNDTVAQRQVKLKEIKLVKKVSSEKMFEILNEVRMEKLKANNPAKCVSVQIVNSTNAENGSMIANYLRKNGYIISGREVVQGSQKGIRINAEGPCLKLSIGTL